MLEAREARDDQRLIRPPNAPQTTPNGSLSLPVPSSTANMKLVIRLSPKGDKDKTVEVDANKTVAELKAQLSRDKGTR